MEAYSHLSPEEQRILIERSISGEAPIFAGERTATSRDSRHTIYSGRNFEVTPEELIEVAKHIATPSEDHRDTMIRAHALICEAHLLSRNLRHWNEAQDRHHASDVIAKLVKQHVIKEGEHEGEVPKTDLVSALLKHHQMASNKTDADKTFNEWIKHKVRRQDFELNFPCSPSHLDFDPFFYQKHVENGWIRRITLGSSVWFLPPQATEPPPGRPRKPLDEGEHPTRPYWETKSPWWPPADESDVRADKLFYLTSDFRRFRSSMIASMALQRLDQWLRVKKAETEACKSTRRRKRSRSGQFEKADEKDD